MLHNITATFYNCSQKVLNMSLKREGFPEGYCLAWEICFAICKHGVWSKMFASLIAGNHMYWIPFMKGLVCRVYALCWQVP